MDSGAQWRKVIHDVVSSRSEDDEANTRHVILAVRIHNVLIYVTYSLWLLCIVVDQVIVGSYHGRLAVYQPQPTKMDEKTRGFSADDVICELQLSYPILQIGTGRFSS